MEVKPERKVIVLEDRPTTHYCRRNSPCVVSPTAELGCIFHSAAQQYHPELLFASRRSYPSSSVSSSSSFILLQELRLTSQ
jgi:hypothetical protein